MSAENSDPNIKNIKLVPGLATEGGKSRKNQKKGVRKTFKIDRGDEQEGAGSTSPGTLTQLSASHVAASPGAKEPVGVDAPLTAKGAPVGGGAAQKPMKVVLAAAKKKERVVLAPAKVTVPGKTRKVSRAKKVRVTISNLSKKIDKAKEIRKTAADSTVDEVKKALHKAGLIKADSKAPETMLRQMYADYMTLKGRAL
jgi:hypothetical protein